MELSSEQTYALIGAGGVVGGFILRNISTLFEWAKVLYRGITVVFGVVYKFRKQGEQLEEIMVRVERLERLLVVLMEQLDFDPEDANSPLDSIADLAPHEQELIIAWRKMREVPDAARD